MDITTEGESVEYAILYLRPDGWWVAGDGWPDRKEAEEAAAEEIPPKPWCGDEKSWKVVESGSPEHIAAQELEAREA